MRPRIDSSRFGSITIEGESFHHDVVIQLDGKIRRRKKRLSKALYGTSHRISLDEAKDLHEAVARRLILGAGHYAQVGLSQGAIDFFKQHGCDVTILSPP